MKIKSNKLITRMFSDPEFEKKVNEKVDEAKAEGSATLEEDGEKLQFAETGDGQVIVEDKVNDEATVVSEDENGERQVEAMPVEETKAESETQPDVKVEKVEGKDGEAISETVPEVKVEVSTGINDAEKAGLKAYSMVFSGVNAEFAAKYAKAFSDAIAEVMVDEPKTEIAEQQKETAEALEGQGERAAKLAEEPCPEKKFSDEDPEEMAEAQAVIDDAKQLQDDVDAVKESKDAEKIESCKKMSKSILSRANKLFSKGHDTSSLISQVLTFSDELDALQEAKPEEVKSEAEEVKAAEKVDAPEAAPASTEEVEKSEVEDAVKAESSKQFSACLRTSFDDCSVRPVVKPTQDKTFSTTTETKEKPQRGNNPFLYTKFE